jgi:SAM-dependent methyltransferase
LISDREKIEARVRELEEIQPWNHDHVLPYGIRTRPGQQESHGKNHVKLDRLQPLFDIIGLNGKTILDVGCNEGFFSLHMAEAGAKVLGIDIDDKRIEKARFALSMHESLDNIRFELVDIYSDKFNELPRFDLCLCLGFIHRVPDPYRAMSALADRSEMIIFEWKALKFGPHDEAFAYFSPKGIPQMDLYGTEYWLLSYMAVERIMRRFNFCYFYPIDDPSQNRAILVAGRNHHPIFDKRPVKLHRGRLKSLLSHTKRYLYTIGGIISGRINA